jgi:membrane protein required for colicin V production
MNSLDIVILIILATSILVSVLRGAVREILYLVGWVAAFAVSAFYGSAAGQWLAPDVIGDAWLRSLSGYVVTFLVTLIVMSTFAGLASKFIHQVGLGGPDRALGAVFGALRGLMIILLLAVLAGLTRLPAQAVWRDSMVTPWLELTVLTLRPYLPARLGDAIAFSAKRAAPPRGLQPT